MTESLPAVTGRDPPGPRNCGPGGRPDGPRPLATRAAAAIADATAAVSPVQRASTEGPAPARHAPWAPAASAASISGGTWGISSLRAGWCQRSRIASPSRSSRPVSIAVTSRAHRAGVVDGVLPAEGGGHHLAGGLGAHLPVGDEEHGAQLVGHRHLDHRAVADADHQAAEHRGGDVVGMPLDPGRLGDDLLLVPARGWRARWRRAPRSARRRHWNRARARRGWRCGSGCATPGGSAPAAAHAATSARAIRLRAGSRSSSAAPGPGSMVIPPSGLGPRLDLVLQLHRQGQDVEARSQVGDGRGDPDGDAHRPPSLRPVRARSRRRCWPASRSPTGAEAARRSPRGGP